MTQKNRILGAALALDTFTAGELAAYVGANPHTVRSELGRNRDLVEVIDLADDDDSPRSPGRPPLRYRVADRTMLLQQLGGDVQDPIRVPDVDAPIPSADEDELLLLESAELSLSRALAADPEQRGPLVVAAAADAALVLEKDGPTDPERRARADRVVAVTDVLRAPQAALDSAFAGLARATAALVHAKPASLQPSLRLLLELTGVYGLSPPLAIVTSGLETPQEVVSGLDSDTWTSRARARAAGRIWTPTWAEALLDERLLAGVVLHHPAHDSDDTLAAALDEFEEWSVPMIVVTSSSLSAAASVAAQRGAAVLSSLDTEVVIAWLGRALQYYRRDLGLVAGSARRGALSVAAKADVAATSWESSTVDPAGFLDWRSVPVAKRPASPVAGPVDCGYSRATSVDDAIGQIAALGGNARFLAGGHSLIPMMKLRLASPEHLIDITPLEPALSYIRQVGDEIRIGAMTHHVDVLASDLLRNTFPNIFSEAKTTFSDPVARNRGTLGGSLCQADPAEDLYSVVMALQGTVVVRGPGGAERLVGIDDFQVGPYMTAIAPTELLIEVRFKVRPGHGSAHEAVERRGDQFPVASASTALCVERGVITWAGVACSTVGAASSRIHRAEAALVGEKPSEKLFARCGALASADCSPGSDAGGPVDYKRHVAGVLTKRALARAATTAMGKAQPSARDSKVIGLSTLDEPKLGVRPDAPASQ